MTTHTLNTLLTRRQKGAILALAFTTAAALGMTAQHWDPYAMTTPGQVVDDTATPDPMTTDPRSLPTIPPCASDDGSGPLPCHWDATAQGNGEGDSFTINADGTITYDR